MKEVNSGGALRPESYPRSVLWNIEDCQHYGLVTEKNASRPPMEKCVRNRQGEVISTSEYNAIKTTARMLVNIHLVSLGTPADPAARVKTKTKTYYKKYFLQNFKDVLDKLEAQEPLLTLCAARWKAEHIIANCLTALVDTEKAAKRKDAAREGIESDDTGLDSQLAKRQRTETAASQEELGLRKKKKRNHGGSKGEKNICCDFFFFMLVNPPQLQPHCQLLPHPPRYWNNWHPLGHNKLPTPLFLLLQASPSCKIKVLLQVLLVCGILIPILSMSMQAVSLQVLLHKYSTTFILFQILDSSLKGSSQKPPAILSTTNNAHVDEFIERFPGNQEAINLLDAMESSPEFKVGKSSDDFTTFVERIKNANPNDPNLSEDDLDASWGHYQFTGGRLTCTTVLTSWDVIGGCSNACDLIAAALRTCKVARHLCFERNVEARSYLSDVYLENVVSKLWDLWKSAGGVRGYFFYLATPRCMFKLIPLVSAHL